MAREAKKGQGMKPMEWLGLFGAPVGPDLKALEQMTETIGVMNETLRATVDGYTRGVEIDDRLVDMIKALTATCERLEGRLTAVENILIAKGLAERTTETMQ